MSVAVDFRERFGVAPAARGSAFGRVNLMGDHTDYNGGFVLPIAIARTTAVEAAIGDGQHQVYSAALGRTVRFGWEKLTDFGRYVGGCVRVLEQQGVRVPPLRLSVHSDVPVGAGLSSSAALEVATLRAIDALLGLGLDDERVAMLAHHAETEFAGVACGIMDQMACALATPERMMFLDTRSLERRLLPLPEGTELLVMHCGVPRELAASAYNLRRAECAAAAKMLGVASLREVSDPTAVESLPPPLRERARHVVSENARVLAAVTADAAGFGAIMSRSHASLRDDYAVSIPAMDALVDAIHHLAGVYGARLTGAGFGGCCVALVRAGTARDIAERVMSAGLSPQPARIVPGD